jgi:hypothetical protein
MPLFRGLRHWLACNWSAGSLTGFRRKRRFALGSRMPKASAWHGPTPALARPLCSNVADDGGWNIRILHPVAQAIHADALRWGALETGGALVGRISFENRTITIAGIVDAPPDSIREAARFVLGTNGLVQNLRTANRASLGYLAFIGTWHSHPKGGAHSGIDRNTLRSIAEDAGGLPAVSLVWTPTGLRCAVDRW